jgi:hypothetical protein
MGGWEEALVRFRATMTSTDTPSHRVREEVSMIRAKGAMGLFGASNSRWQVTSGQSHISPVRIRSRSGANAVHGHIVQLDEHQGSASDMGRLWTRDCVARHEPMVLALSRKFAVRSAWPTWSLEQPLQ